MFQSFDSPSTTEDTRSRVDNLRKHMRAEKIDAYLVPRADEYQGEYVPPQSERLRWLTGFSGSAGFAIVAKKAAALFVDGRYTLQARNEIDTRLFEVNQIPQSKLSDWVPKNLSKNCVIGFDPKLHTINEITRLTVALNPHEVKLKPIARKNLVDQIWDKRDVKRTIQKISVHPIEFTGISHTDKIADIQKELTKQKQDVAILTMTDSVSWLFNIRGQDIAHNPVVLAFSIIPAKGKCQLFIAPEKLTPEVRDHLQPVAKIYKPSELSRRLNHLKNANARARIDPTTAAYWFKTRLTKNQTVFAPDPCLKKKAIKNDVEIDGARRAHLRDGVAVTRFLHWLENEIASPRPVDEISAAKKLEQFRAQSNALREISFDTIAGSGPNGAIIHYRVNKATNRNLNKGELFLVDSGAQYQDGTTDITRTVAIGKPTREMCDRFTRVLKGHIAIATAKFPVGSRGIDLDPFARRALWDEGLDYDHGTGHGVGSYLCVHEGPISISRKGMLPLKPGMILSNEPGYYKESHFGIRIENLILVVRAPSTPKSEREILTFETLTLAPIDRNLIAVPLLTIDERDWVNTYHRHVFKKLSPKLDKMTRSWLKTATAEV